jgi:hypothetical protein
MSDILVEQQKDGSYKALQNHRTIATGDTQQEAIDQAHKRKPDDPILTERVRHTGVGKPDKWRRVHGKD